MATAAALEGLLATRSINKFRDELPALIRSMSPSDLRASMELIVHFQTILNVYHNGEAFNLDYRDPEFVRKFIRELETVRRLPDVMERMVAKRVKVD